MVKKVKGIKISKDTITKIKFSDTGTSQLGDADSSHEIKGETKASGSINVTGELNLTERVGGGLFSPPQIDGATETAMLQEFIDNAATKYEGFIFYLTNESTLDPFKIPQKFYFCEEGSWFPSPFHSGNYPPNLNPLYEVSVPASGMDSAPFSLDFPSDLFLDQDGDELTYTATKAGGDPLPAWLSFDATNTILSGTPTEADVGLLVLTITATDPSSESASTTQEIQILVKPIPFWAGGTPFGYENSYYSLEDALYTTPAGGIVIDPYFNGDYTMTAPDEIDLAAGPIDIEFNFDGPLTDGMGIRWGSAAGGSYGTNYFAFGLKAPGASKTIWLGAVFGQSEYGNGGLYSNDDAHLSIRPLKQVTTGTDPVPDYVSSTSVYYKPGFFYRDPPQNSWQSPADRMVQVPDLEFKLRIDGYRTSATTGNGSDDFIDVILVAKLKNPPQSVIDAGYGDVTLDDLLDASEGVFGMYYNIPDMQRNAFFHRQVQSFHLNGGSGAPTGMFTPFAHVHAGNHNDGAYSPNHACAAPVITSWTQNAYLPPICNYPASVTQLAYADNTLAFVLEEDYITSQNDFTKAISYANYGTTIAYSAQLLDGSPLPSWMTFNSSTRTLTLSPTDSEIGLHSVEFTGNDSLGMSATGTRTFEVQAAPIPDAGSPLVPNWNDPGNYTTGPAGSLTLDGQSTNEWHYAYANTLATDLIAGTTYNDISKALILEWTYDGTDTADQGLRNVLSQVGLMNSDTNVAFKFNFGSVSSGGNWSARNIQGQRSPGGNNLYTTFGTLNDNPADWTFRLFLKPDMWWTDGSEKVRSIMWGIAGKKNDSSSEWGDIMNAAGSSTALTYGGDKFIYWGTHMYWTTNSSNSPSSFPVIPYVASKPNSNNNTAELHMSDVKVFFEELEPNVAPTVNQSYDYSTPYTAYFDAQWNFTFPSDLFTDANTGDQLTYSAEVYDGSTFSALPSWLSFDPITRQLSGTPAESDEDTLNIWITATDTEGLTASTSINVVATAQISVPDPVTGGFDLTPILVTTVDASLADIALQPDGTTILSPPTNTSPQWETAEIAIPSGKKLVVKWEYDALEDGSFLQESNASYNNGMSISIRDGNGYSWKYFQFRRAVSYPPIGYMRYSGSGVSPSPNTFDAGIDFSNSQLRMETTFDGATRVTKMKIRPSNGALSFDELISSSQTGGGYFYVESSFATTQDARINVSGIVQELDSLGQYIKFKYLRYELVDE